MPIRFPEPRPPLPPDELISRVMPHFSPEQAEEVRASWNPLAEITVRSQEAALAGIGRELTDFARALDFGCGTGRAFALLQEIAGSVELHGVDIDRDSIDWATRNVPFAQWHLGPQEPPLPFGDGHFDLVVNHSVFTHLDERMQDLWLAELRRVVAPNGILLLTVHGGTMIEALFDGMAGAGEDVDAARATLAERGLLFFEDDGYVGSVHPEYYHSAYHAPWYIYAHWGQFFSVRALLSPGSWGGHDIVVLERTEGDAPAITPIHPRAAAAPLSVANEAPEQAAGDRLRRLAADWPAPRTAAGRVKRRLLAAEYDLLRRLADTAASEFETARPDAPASADDERPSRRERMVRLALYQQAERLTLVEREFRERLEALEGTDRG